MEDVSLLEMKGPMRNASHTTESQSHVIHAGAPSAQSRSEWRLQDHARSVIGNRRPVWSNASLFIARAPLEILRRPQRQDVLDPIAVEMLDSSRSVETAPR
jgi:hypothetical protein